MTAIVFAIVVTDGTSLRTIHPPALGAYSTEVERILRAYLFGEPVRAAPAVQSVTLTQREIATSQGFTGDACSTCGTFAMKRAGTCLTCQSCGSTTGCG